MARKKTKKNQDQADSPVNSKSDTVNNENLETDLDFGIDDFSELFGDGTQNIKVQLYRISPEYFAGEKISGFIRYLLPGEDIGSIADQHGGGIYVIRKLIDSRFTGIQRRLPVAGPPKVGVPPQLDGDGAGAADYEKTDPRDLEPVEIDGVKISGSDAGFIRMVERIKLYKHLFPEPVSINDTLLRMVLERDNNSGFEKLLENADKIGSLIDRFAPRTGGETNLLDLGREALKAFTHYVDKAAAGKPGIPPPRVAVPGVKETAQPVIEPTDRREIAEKLPVGEPENEQIYTGENGLMNQSGQHVIIEKACSYIVGGFLQDPIQSEAETVQVLKLVLPPFDVDGLNEIYDNRKEIRLVARTILTNQVETESEMIEKFSLYFDNVIYIFCQRSESISEKNKESEAEHE